MKFKVGDKVRRNKNAMNSNNFCDACAPSGIAAICEITKIIDDESVNVRCPDGTTEYMSAETIELVKLGTLKNPTHLVVWDEHDRDPHRFFINEKYAKEFVKELSEKSDVKKDSIILVAIKSTQKVKVIRNVRLTSFKI